MQVEGSAAKRHQLDGKELERITAVRQQEPVLVAEQGSKVLEATAETQKP